MTDAGEVSPDEVILKRVKRHRPDCTHPLPGGGLRGTSYSIKERPDEIGSSCSRLCLTSPRKVLDLVRLHDLDPDEFLVCCIRVADVRDLQLDVIALPTKEDAGHCEIRPSPHQPFSKTIWSKLAKKTRILTDEEVRQLEAGGTMDE